MTDKSYVCDVYVYSISNGELIERIGKLYRNDSLYKTGSIYIGGINNITLLSAQMQPGIIWSNKYVWFYKSNKRAAAKVFQNDILERIKDYSNKMENAWTLYGALSNYTK